MESKRAKPRNKAELEETPFFPNMPQPNEHILHRIVKRLNKEGWVKAPVLAEAMKKEKVSSTDFARIIERFSDVIASQPGKGYKLIANMGEEELDEHIRTVEERSNRMLAIAAKLRAIQLQRKNAPSPAKSKRKAGNHNRRNS